MATTSCRVGSQAEGGLVDAAPDDGAPDEDDGGGARPDEPPPLWDELSSPVIQVGGGAAVTVDDGAFFPDGHGADAGRVRVRSRGPITLDAALPDPAAPPAMASAQGGAELSDVDLVADVTRSATLRVSGTLTASGAGATRMLTSTEGDIVIEGHLRSGELAGGRRSLALHAPNGTVYVSGTIETRAPGDARAGRDGGDIEIRARNVVIVGELRAEGEPGTSAGGAGGAIDVIASDGPVFLRDGAIVTAGGASDARGGAGGAIDVRGEDVWMAGIIDGGGGDVRALADARGGDAGDVHLRASRELFIGASVRLRGGAASTVGVRATGGAAGAIFLDADDALRVGAAIDARGGFARAAYGGTVIGGAGGSCFIGDDDAPATVELRVPIEAAGGPGFVAAGQGGRVELDAIDGDLVLATTIRVDGGASAQRAGDAGVVSVIAGPAGGGIRLTGAIVGVGGSATSGGDADGGTGARVELDILSRDGDLDITAAGALVIDGGAAASNGEAGGGGDLTMLTRDGAATVAGQVIARGGAAPGAGGRGGRGGIVNLFTDANHDGIGGDLLVDTTGVIDVSGGAGSHGGSARNNGGAGVALFPDDQDEIAVLLNSDGMHGSPRDGDLVNRGHIIARGDAVGGSGGDIMFHGRRPSSSEDPLPGDLSLEGDGDGHAGQFAAE
ncbi:MAG TPA: hypothetical protein VM261_33345 [Kofleriaceae bacterium]|nr:hypothetical protein [Kofleriaceae bacterium]